jgi:hypothetical protein
MEVMEGEKRESSMPLATIEVINMVRMKGAIDFDFHSVGPKFMT